MSGTHVWVNKACSPDAQDIFQTENEDRHDLYDAENRGETGQFFKRLHKGDNDICKDRYCNKNIKQTADMITPVANLQHSK